MANTSREYTAREVVDKIIQKEYNTNIMKKGYIIISMFIALLGIGILTTPQTTEAEWSLSIGIGFGGGGYYDDYGYGYDDYGYGYDDYGYGYDQGYGDSYYGSNVQNNYYYGGYPSYGYSDVIYPTYGYYDTYANNPYTYGGWYGNGYGYPPTCFTYSC